MGAIDPWLSHVTQVNLVRNERKNMLNIRIKRGFHKLLFNYRPPTNLQIQVCFFLSPAFEPFVNVSCLHQHKGNLTTWSAVNEIKDMMTDAISAFLAKEKLTSPATCRYLKDEHGNHNEVEGYEALPGVSAVSWSIPFDLSLRVPVGTLRNHLAILKVFTEEQVKQATHVIDGGRDQGVRWINNELDQIHPLLRHLVYKQNNGVELQPRFLTTAYLVNKKGVWFEFHLSEKLEPYVIIIVICPVQGKLHWLTRTQIDGLGEAINEFKGKFGIKGESYHYTSLAERRTTDAFVKAGGANIKSKAHSSDFHLKMRISSAMLTDFLRIMRMFDFNSVRQKVEPVRYNFSRENVTYNEAREVLLTEVDG